MKKHDVLKALNRIIEMSDEELFINADYIRNVSQAAYGLIKQQARKKKVRS